jgi:hypothetical protein
MVLDITNLRRLYEAASSGPWVKGQTRYAYEESIGGPDGGKGYTKLMSAPEQAADGELIVAAVNALPQLLDELERLRVLEAEMLAARAEEAGAQAAEEHPHALLHRILRKMESEGASDLRITEQNVEQHISGKFFDVPLGGTAPISLIWMVKALMPAQLLEKLELGQGTFIYGIPSGEAFRCRVEPGGHGSSIITFSSLQEAATHERSMAWVKPGEELKGIAVREFAEELPVRERIAAEVELLRLAVRDDALREQARDRLKRLTSLPWDKLLGTNLYVPKRIGESVVLEDKGWPSKTLRE